MTSKRYLSVLIATFVIGLLLVIASSYWSNAYGLFGDAKGRSLVAYRGERTTKFLLAQNYVPSNFNSLLLGASISLNWNTKRIPNRKIYNASISGANISEERLIAEQVLQRKQLEWLILVLHPYLTMSHGRKTEEMTPREYWSAFGSLSLFFLESTKLLAEHHILKDRHNEYGDSNYDEGLSASAARASMDKYIQDRRLSGKPSRNFEVDPSAFEDLASIVADGKRQHARILVVYPPIYRERFDVERADWEAYWRRVRPLLPLDAAFLNFNTDEFETLRSDFSNFQDSGHLARKCADAIVDDIGQVVDVARNRPQ